MNPVQRRWRALPLWAQWVISAVVMGVLAFALLYDYESGEDATTPAFTSTVIGVDVQGTEDPATVARESRRRCRQLSLGDLAELLGTGPTRAAVLRAWGSEFSPELRATARTACAAALANRR